MKLTILNIFQSGLNFGNIIERISDKYDKNIVELKAGKAYMLNTKKQHGSFAMVDDIYHILMGIYVNPHNFRVVTDLLPNCIDHG